MGAVWYRARADLRRGRWSTIGLIVLLGFAGGATLAAVAGALRTHDALPEFLAYNNAPEVQVFVNPDLPRAEQDHLLSQVAALPEWDRAAVVSTAGVSVRPHDGDRYQVVLASAVQEADFPLTISRPIIVSGHQPDPTSPTDAVVNEAFAHDLGLEVGDTFDLRNVTAEKLEPFGNGELRLDPDGTDFTMTVTGIERQPTDLRTPAPTRPDSVFGGDAWTVVLTPAWWNAVDGNVASYGGGVLGQLADGVTKADLTDAVAAIDSQSFFVQRNDENGQLLASIRRATNFEAGAVALFAAVLAVAGAVLVGQAIARQVSLRLDDHDALRAAGLTHRQRAAVQLPRTALVAGAGAVLAVLVAVAVSPLAPVGLAKQAELHPGVDVDAPTLLAGAAALVLLTLLWSVAVAWRTSRALPRERATRRDRPSTVGSSLAAVGAGVTTVAGVRLALERGRGRTAVPVVSTLVAGSAGVLIVTAVVTFSFSLAHLIDTPELQGWTWDVTVGNYSEQTSFQQGQRDLEANPLVAGYLGENDQSLSIDGQPIDVATIGPGNPSIGPPVIEGRLPQADGEIALGRRTLADLGNDLGDSVTLDADSGNGPVDATIVGTVVLPASVNNSLTLGDGGLMTLDGLKSVYGPQGDAIVPQSFLVTFEDGVSTAEGVRSLEADFANTITTARAPDDIKNLRRVQGLPALLAVTVGLLALGTLANAMVTCVRRRRRDLATFTTLGFRPRQVWSTVAWQATTVALVSLIVGLPLGVAAGRTVWALVMESIGTSVPAVTPWAAMGLLALAVFVGANLIGALPAHAAARTRPALALRSE